jgi:hypothetical protein
MLAFAPASDSPSTAPRRAVLVPCESEEVAPRAVGFLGGFFDVGRPQRLVEVGEVLLAHNQASLD